MFFRKTDFSLYLSNMLRKTALMGLIVICIKILGFTFMVRDSLCELQIKDGQSIFLAKRAYEVK